MSACSVRFADNYFNYRFVQASKQCTSESEKWLRFAASNVSEYDVNMLNAREKPTTVDVEDARIESDTTGIVILKVNDFLSSDSIGVRGIIIDAAVFQLDMKRVQGKWRVALSSLPRRLKRG